MLDRWKCLKTWPNPCNLNRDSSPANMWWIQPQQQWSNPSMRPHRRSGATWRHVDMKSHLNICLSTLSKSRMYRFNLNFKHTVCKIQEKGWKRYVSSKWKPLSWFLSLSLCLFQAFQCSIPPRDMSSKAKITPPIGAEKVQAKPMAQAANSSFETVEPTSLEPPAGWQLVDGWVLSVVKDCGWIRLNVKFISIHPLLSSSLVVIHWLGESTNS